MKKNQIIITLLLSIFIFSCNEKPKKKLDLETVENLESKVNFKELETDFSKWWNYHSYNITLSSNFIGINEESKKIDKKTFLKKLVSGSFIPEKLESINGIEQYRLHKLSSLSNKSIGSTIKNESLTYLKHYEMESLNFPEFDFTDLKGNNYTNENSKGKFLIVKTWFIKCRACVAEFPELNELVENNINHENIIFLSLALDSKSELEEFLEKKLFKYNVVPNQKEFINEKLNLQIYPTHIVINENGNILKVVNKASELISFLTGNNLFKKRKKNPPPPPAPV